MKVIKGKDYQVNVCDKELIGKKLNEVTVSEHFYGTECPEDKVLIELRKATLINAMGKESVALVKEVKGDIRVLEVNGIPHVQFFTLNP